MTRTITNPANNSSLSSSVIRDELQTLEDEIVLKEDKVTGKGLSTNDYTTAEKSKLAGIEALADVTDATNVDAAGAVMTSDKAAGSDIITGTDDAKFLTSKALADASTGKIGAAWTDYEPTFTASSGTPTTVYINKSSYFRIGKVIIGRLDCVITNKGTASGILRFTLPVTAQDAGFGGCGAESAATGLALSVYGYDTTHANVVTAAAGTVWVDNYRLQISYTYQAA